MVDWNFQRGEAIKTIIGSVKIATKAKVPVDENKLSNEIALMYGFSTKRIREYISNLIGAEKLIRKDGFLWTK